MIIHAIIMTTTYNSCDHSNNIRKDSNNHTRAKENDSNNSQNHTISCQKVVSIVTLIVQIMMLTVFHNEHTSNKQP